MCAFIEGVCVCVCVCAPSFNELMSECVCVPSLRECVCVFVEGVCVRACVCVIVESWRMGGAVFHNLWFTLRLINCCLVLPFLFCKQKVF